MPDNNEQSQSHLTEAIRSLRLRHLLQAILPFAPTVMMIDCHEHLVRWVAARTDWVVAIDHSLPRLERSHGFEPLVHGWDPDNLDTFHGTLAEYIESPDAWGWRLGFDLVVADGVLAQALEPALELARMRGWAPWILAAASLTELRAAPAGEENKEAFLGLFEKVIICEDDGDAVIVLGR